MQGVPSKLRPMVWMAVSGAAHLRAQYVASYFITCATLPVTNADHEAHIKQIELDVTRTFPEHPFFKERHGQQALTMTLRAYATHDPVVGYCQSMNYVAAFLLLVLNKDAEQAFWVLVVLLQGPFACNRTSHAPITRLYDLPPFNMCFQHARNGLH